MMSVSLFARATFVPFRRAASVGSKPALPDVPTTVEAGVPGSDYVFWVGMLAPAKTPHEVVLKLNAEVVKTLNMPDVKARLASLGTEPMPMTPEAFDAFIRTEVEQALRLAKAANLTPQ